MSENRVKLEEVEHIKSNLNFVFNVIEGTTTTTCHAFYKGFSVGYGLSACIDPANFDKDLGEKYAKERALADSSNNIWLLEGWAQKFHERLPQ